jgi:hypothetical protein
MRVNSNTETWGVTGVPSRTPAREPRLEQDKVSLTSTEALNTALDNTPPVRGEKVEQARKLVQDTSYPPQVLIRKLSALFADKIKQPDAPEQSSTDTNSD